mmetsp:Transcript_52968/g.103609  ORF Transcript_52968/g.103609 Transcript_52968/m.103609 type:complete len:116 (+) Transcript_52968:971-1318(+)
MCSVWASASLPTATVSVSTGGMCRLRLDKGGLLEETRGATETNPASAPDKRADDTPRDVRKKIESINPTELKLTRVLIVESKTANTCCTQMEWCCIVLTPPIRLTTGWTMSVQSC